MTVAPWSKRAFAWLIDMHISMIFLVVAYVVSDWGFDTYDGLAAWSICIVSLVLWWQVGFVNRCVRMGRKGQSWGRMLFNISLVRESDGQPIGVWGAFMRENFHFVDWFSLGVGWTRPLRDPKGQTFADAIRKTITVYGPPPMTAVVLATDVDVADAPVAEVPAAAVPAATPEPV